MILFVFEGDEREPRLYRTLERLYFPNLPTEKSIINQLAIFKSQVSKFVEPSKCVAVLNSFPIFIYDYMK